MVTANDNFVTVNGARLQYTEFGDPATPAVLCLHGFSFDAHAWDAFAERISDRFHVLALTVRGHGDSDRAESYDDPFLSIHDAAAFLDALNVERAITIGHSMGANIAGGLAIFHKEKVSKLVLGDSGPDGDPAGEERMFRYVSDWPEQLPGEEAIVDFYRSHFADGFSDGALQYIAKHAAARQTDGSYRMKLDPVIIRNNVERGVQSLPPSESPLWQFIAQITPPTLIVRGTQTVYFPRACAERMVREMPDARLVEIDTGHALFMQDLDAFYNAVIGFLTE
jgi:pimeloyl-ACP methyl ester carboxylesterase